MASLHLIIQHAAELKDHFLSPKWTEQKNFLHREPVLSDDLQVLVNSVKTLNWWIYWLSWLDLEASENNLGCELWIMARILVCVCVSPWRHSQFRPLTDSPSLTLAMLATSQAWSSLLSVKCRKTTLGFLRCIWNVEQYVTADWNTFVCLSLIIYS